MTFLSPDYLIAKITEMETKAGMPVSHPGDTVRQVAKAVKFSDEMADQILAHFVRGGQLTAGGVMQAVTSVSQTLADAANDMEAAALRVLDVAAPDTRSPGPPPRSAAGGRRHLSALGRFGHTCWNGHAARPAPHPATPTPPPSTTSTPC